MRCPALALSLVLAAATGAAGPPDEPSDVCSRAKAARLAARPASMAAGRLDLPPDPYADDTDVLHYLLDIEVRPAQLWLGGSNTLEIRVVTEALRAFRFRLHDVLSVKRVTVDGTVAAWRRLDGTTVEVTLPKQYSTGDVLDLEVEYEGYPQTVWGRSIIFGTHAGQPVVGTLSEPWAAYSWWPVKEENRDKATADLLITVPSPLVAVANGVLVDTASVAGGRTRYHWRTAYATAPYLFGFSITNYTSFAGTYNHDGSAMPVQFFVYPEHDTADNRLMWSQSVAMLGVFADLFGPYPFVGEKYGIYEAPFTGGMEHQTISGQGGFPAFATSLTSHELAHQWWGDMVTCATWHDIWLSEGFATYAEALWLEHRTGSTGAPALKDAMAARRPTSVDGSVYVFDVSNLSRIFSRDYSYLKAAWVLHMLRHVIGDARFFALLRSYRASFAFGTVTTEEFKALAEAACGRSLTWFFDRWVYGSGAPAYALGWQNVTAAGRSYVEVHIEQTQAAPAPVFPMPIDMVAKGAGGDAGFVVWNGERSQHFLLAVDTAVDSLALDPGGWVLNLGIAAVGFTPGPAKIVATFPAPGASVGVGDVLRIEVTFHKGVLVQASHFALVDANGHTVACDFAYDEASHKVTLTPRAALALGAYTLSVSDSIRDAESGLALDGEILGTAGTAALPSGDGVPGGTAVIRFTVLRPPRRHLRAAP